MRKFKNLKEAELEINLLILNCLLKKKEKKVLKAKRKMK